MKQTVAAALLDPKSPHYFLVSDTLAFFTLLSIISIILETVPSLKPYELTFFLIEWITVVVFSVEYLARVWVNKPWYQYSFSFYGIVDLVSVLPTLLGLGNLTFLKSARVIRLIRLLRMVRLAKLRGLRVSDIDQAGSVLALNVGIYTTLLVGSLLLFGVVVHVTEPGSSQFSSIPASMWWAFRSFTGDQPLVGPLSQYGDTLYVFARFVGLVLLGALVGITGNIMQHYLLDRPKKIRQK